VLVDRQHRALSDSPFSVAFESRRSANPREVGGFSTDSRGRYCIVWAEERITPSAVLDRRSEVGIDAPWHALNGSARPPGCQAGDHGIPRNRADDLKSSTQFVAVPAVTLPAMALLLLGLVLGRRPAGRYTRTAGLVVTLAGTLLAAALWFA
jgi:hypothetical protein